MEMNYLKVGSGDKTMLILPGLSLKEISNNPEPVIDSYHIFLEEFTVYLFDCRKDINEGYSISDMANDTITKINELGLKDLYLYGVSLGGMVCLMIALKQPALIKKMALASTCATGKDNLVIKKWQNLAREKDVKQLCDSFALNIYSDDFYKQNHDLIMAAAIGVNDEDLRHFIICCDAILNFDILDELNNIHVPSLMLCSSYDKVINIKDMIATAKSMNGDIYIYHGYGHAIEALNIKEHLIEFYR